MWLDTSFPPNGVDASYNDSNTAWIGATSANLVQDPACQASPAHGSSQPGRRFLEVELQAAGGGGGGGDRNTGSVRHHKSAGGGAGGGCRSLYRAETLPDSVVITMARREVAAKQGRDSQRA